MKGESEHSKIPWVKRVKRELKLSQIKDKHLSRGKEGQHGSRCKGIVGVWGEVMSHKGEPEKSQWVIHLDNRSRSE